MSNFCGMVIAGIGAATTIAGGLMQGDAAGDAAGISAAQAAANAKRFDSQKAINDLLLQGAMRYGQGQINQATDYGRGQLDDALQYGQQQYQPYAYLGRQGNDALSRYLGFAPQYGRERPERPANIEARMNQWRAEQDKPGEVDLSQIRKPRDYNYYIGRRENPSTAQRKAAEDQARYDREVAEANANPPKATLTPAQIKSQQQKFAAQFGKDTKQYKNKLAQWLDGRAAHDKRQRGRGDFGDYFRPYTRQDLMRDPIYKTELRENVRAWDQSAASRGSLMSGNTVAGLRDLTAAGIQRGYDRDWNQRNRKYGALTGLSTMGQNTADKLSDLKTRIAAGQAANQWGGTNALLQNNQWGVGNQLQNNQWATSGATGHAQTAADANASGRLAQGNAMGNAFGNIGQLGMMYGMGAFTTPSYASDPGGKVGPWW